MTRSYSDRAAILPLLAETFRELGYEGASLARITERTGLGKGSLYHFFPGGKAEMAAAVLDAVDSWFAEAVFTPLTQEPPETGIARMLTATDEYFRSGRRVCLVGAFALDDTRDRFRTAIDRYFSRWIDSLDTALQRLGREPATARALAEETVLGIQGALVLARATDDPAIFSRTMARLAGRLGVDGHENDRV